MSETKDLILHAAFEAGTNFILYDRTEDETLPSGVIQEEIKKGNITIEEIASVFKNAIRKMKGEMSWTK